MWTKSRPTVAAVFETLPPEVGSATAGGGPLAIGMPVTPWSTAFNLLTPAMQASADTIALCIQMLLDPLTLAFQSLGLGLMPMLPGPIGLAIETRMDFLTLAVQMLIDAASLRIQMPFDAFTGPGLVRRCDSRWPSEGDRRKKEKNGTDFSQDSFHGSLLVFEPAIKNKRTPGYTVDTGCKNP